MSYKKGRWYEIQTVNIVKKYANLGWNAVRAFLSGQGGREDIKLSIPTGPDDGIVLNAEQKVMKSMPKRLWEWKKDNDLLIVKKIGKGYPRLVLMDFEEFLQLVGNLARPSHSGSTVDNIPNRGDEPF